MYKAKPIVMGNPDRGQDPNGKPYGVEIKTIAADTIPDLREKIWDWQIDNDIGAGNWKGCTVVKDRKIIGYMSYNGKIWDRNIWDMQAKEINL